VTSTPRALPDLIGEAWSGIARRPLRSVLTALGTVIGIGALVATVGLTATAQAQIAGRFDALLATRVVLQADDGARVGLTDDQQDDAALRLASLNGVEAVGELIAAVEPARVARLPAGIPGAAAPEDVAIVAAGHQALTAARAHVVGGRHIDGAANELGLQVALIGAAAAQKLGITQPDQQPTILVDGVPFRLVGVITDAGTEPELLLSILVPKGLEPKLSSFNKGSAARWILRTRPGAAQQVGAEAPVALRPDAPGTVTALVPPAPSSLRQDVERDTRNIFLALAGLSLLVGAVGISNSSLVSVMERRTEIGLRRALGATRGTIVGQFLLESSLVALIGGFIGALLAVDVVVGVALVKQWTPVLDPLVPLFAVPLAAVVGLLAGGYPALRAARVPPVDALHTS
jgi:putative ABC transport system permease protein